MKIHANRTTGNCSRWPDCGWAWLPGKAILIAALAVTNTLAPMGQVRLRNLKSKPMVKVPTTFLQVRLPSVTGTKWGNHLKINWQMKSVKSGGTQQQALWFRWTTSVKKPKKAIVGARWEIYTKKKGYPAEHLVDSGKVAGSATFKRPRVFKILFAPSSHIKYYVKVIPFVANTGETLTPSAPVTLQLLKPAGPGQGQKFKFSKMKITITEIEIDDDSDSVGAGELHFDFWLEYGRKKSPIQSASCRCPTGRVFRLSPSITLIPQGIPSVVYIYAYGEDDDRPDGLEGDRFVVAGAYPSGKPIKGFDIAKGSTFIRLTAGHTQAVAPRPFPKIVATGPDGLRFTVKGTWQVAP